MNVLQNAVLKMSGIKSTNAIFVINQGDFMQPVTRASINAAQERWGCHLIEVKASDNTLHPACWKTTLLATAKEMGIARFMSLDADVVVAASCPSPFTQFADDKIIVVSDRQTHCPARDKAEIDEVEIITGYRTKLPNYFNSGVIVASAKNPQHYRLFEYASELCEQHRHLCWHDQTPFNVSLSQQAGVSFVDQTWNFLNPAGRIANWQQMQKNIYHFAGNPSRHQQIAETNWKV